MDSCKSVEHNQTERNTPSLGVNRNAIKFELHILMQGMAAFHITNLSTKRSKTFFLSVAVHVSLDYRQLSRPPMRANGCMSG